MAKAKRVAPEMKTVLAFQHRFERELTEVQRQAEESKKRAEKKMEKTQADYQKIAAGFLKVVDHCHALTNEMQKILQVMSSQATQPATKVKGGKS